MQFITTKQNRAVLLETICFKMNYSNEEKRRAETLFTKKKFYSSRQRIAHNVTTARDNI